MQIQSSIADIRRALHPASRRALIPTMGNLHEGHLQLIRHAVRERDAGRIDTVIATIFVNRLQFLPHEDFAAYPRTLEQDAEKLRHAGCDILFAPTEDILYPNPQTFKVHPDPHIGDILEGAFRPGFFIGVCTVVMKLFQIIAPTMAVFGKKDYQQFLVLRRMVEQFAMPIDMVGIPTERAADGLALSSRNGYLSPAERQQALALSTALRHIAQHIQNGAADWQAVEQQGVEQLRQQGWEPDYLSIRNAQTLDLPTSEERNNPNQSWVVLGAARLGKTRLIDNLEFHCG